MVAAAHPDAPKPPKNRLTPSPIPIGVKLRARNLYLVHGLPYAEISEQVGLTVQQLGALAHREGWTKNKARNRAKMIARADARIDRDIDETNEALARESEEIALKALGKAREEVESGGEFAARNFQSWTGGVSNLVKVQRLTRGLDGEQQQGATNVSLSLFCVQASPAPQPAAERQEKRVEPLSVDAKALPS